ncbi:MAG: hypothetical protein ACE5Q6_17290, partial [Dehalococcoidia bacterium]
MGPDLTFEISINRTCPGEKLPSGDPRWHRFTRSFYGETHTLDSLIAEIRRGRSFAPVVKDGHRKQQNFLSAQHLGLDSDTGDWRSSLESLQADAFIREQGALLYETHSSTSEHPKARILFLLERPYTDGLAYRTVQQALAWKYGFTDPSVAEESRFFYGAQDCRVVRLGNVLREKVLEAQVIGPYLDHLAEQSESQKRKIPGMPRSRIAGATAFERYVHRAVQEESAWLATRVEGTGERHLGLLVAAMKLASLALSEWLPPEVRTGIDP